MTRSAHSSPRRPLHSQRFLTTMTCSSQRGGTWLERAKTSTTPGTRTNGSRSCATPCSGSVSAASRSPVFQPYLHCRTGVDRQSVQRAAGASDGRRPWSGLIFPTSTWLRGCGRISSWRPRQIRLNRCSAGRRGASFQSRCASPLSGWSKSVVRICESRVVRRGFECRRLSHREGVGVQLGCLGERELPCLGGEPHAY